MNIVIRNYLAGSLLLEQEPRIWDAIVVLDSELSPTEFVARQANRHLYLRFDDVKADVRGKRTPKADDIQAALEFAESSENLMVCCRAGQSRSAAIGFVICAKRLGINSALQLLDPRRHTPNPLIVSLGEKLVGDSMLMSAFERWRSDNAHVRLSDYIDVIEREFDELENQGARNRITEP
jgi:predicted protein tyrosine phosphatase